MISTDLKDIRIINMTGNTIFSLPGLKSIACLDVSDLQKGLYILCAKELESNHVTFKLVK